MRRDHRPYWLKKAYLNFQDFYVRRYLSPQLDRLGDHYTFMKPWYVEIFGPRITIGRHVNIIATADANVRLSVWSNTSDAGYIRIGDYCLICPGVRISSAIGVTVGDNCMFAHGAYITDCDWHDIYNRVSFGKAVSVTIGENVWVGDRAIICKGVSIGNNSIIGAGAVVSKSVPANVVAAGNPAKIVKELDPSIEIITRKSWFMDPELYEKIDHLDKDTLKKNSFLHWLRYLLSPQKSE